MKNLVKRLVSAALLICLILAVFAPATAQAAAPDMMGERYNIMLVIDGSGSLTSTYAGQTDPRGMRYALVGELMGILEDDGHNIGSIVFSGTQSRSANPTDAEMEQGIMLNTGLLSLDELAPDGRTPKDYLESEIRRVNVDLAPHGCTDIGTALKLAQKQLERMKGENGRESVVFLFTDGNTAFYGNPPSVIKKSVENRDEATRQMSEKGIRLFGAFLNDGGKLDDTEMKRLVCAANGISTTSPEFQYSYVEIEDSAGIHAASTCFLKFLNYIDPNYVPDVLYNDVHDTFAVPGIGVEEMNIRLFSPYGDDLPNLDVKITQPDGTVITGVPLKESRTYRVYKLIKPDPGNWKIDITVPAGNALAYVYTPVVSLYIDSQVACNPAPEDLCVNQTPVFNCLLAQAGTVVTDPAAYMGYTCKLLIKNVSNGDTKSYDVQANANGALTHSVLLDTYGTFEAKTVFACGSILVESDPIVLDLTNRTPEVRSIPRQELTYGLFQPKITDLDLTQYFSDPEDGTNLNYAVGSVRDCDDDAFSFSGGIMTITNKRIGDGSFEIVATDSQGASVTGTVSVSTKNVTIWYILALVVLLIIIAIIVLASIKRKNKYRPDGELTVSFDMPWDGKACRIILDLDVPGVDTTSKTNLYKLVQNALRNEDRKIQNGIYARDVMGFLMDFSSALSDIAVCTAVKKVNKKNVGAVSVKQDKKTTVLYNGFADFFLHDASFTVEFKTREEDSDPFGDNDIFTSYQKKNEDNFFADQDDIFQAPRKEKAKKPAKPEKETDFGGSDIDFF